mmetsp:Transcript_112041/g.349178  ORF Transcript_112041/g.349178 Transcript_112041/m.349178 type:complete len:254 (-) Transcript_112041:42-803(-)
MAACLRLVFGSLLVAPARAITKELYTTNAVCSQRYCVNPVFPGLGDLPQLETRRWEKHSIGNVSSFLQFCAGVVDYDVALPKTNGSSALQRYLLARSAMQVHGALDGLPHLMSQTEETVRNTEKEALRTYFMHLSAMGIEAWDHTEPLQPSSHPLRPCARSVARLACFTYFPRAYTGLPDGTEMAYSRPCRNSCQAFLQACGVDCCDDSTACVWDKYAGSEARTTQDVHGKAVLLETGYVDAEGPSLQCTGTG